MRDLRRQNKSEPETKKVSTKSYEKVIETVEVEARKDTAVTAPSLEKELSSIEQLKKKLEEANSKIKSLEDTKRPLAKNEEKLLNAIRTEAIKQDSDWPVISTNKIRKEYKVHPAYFAKSFEALRSMGVIDRKEASYSGNIKTYRYSLTK